MSQKTNTDIHFYVRKGIKFATPKQSIARLRDDFAQPTILGKLVIINGLPTIED